MVRKKWIVLGFLGYMAALLAVTLFTHNYYTYGRSGNLIPLSSIRLMLRSGSALLMAKNIAGNVLLFIPLGFWLPLLTAVKKAFIIQLLLGFAVSVLIESCQFFFAARIFDIDDILLNTSGTAIGLLLYRLIRLIYRRWLLVHGRKV